LLVTYKSSRVNYAYAKPQHLDLAVGGQWHRLDRLLRDYPYPCARASNANYFGSRMQGEAKDSGGAIYDSQIINGRPAVYVKGSRAWYSYDHLSVQDADVAVGAGPMLVVDGVIGDLEARIRYGEFSGLRQTNKCERCAIGYTTDGLLLHVVAEALTLYELAQFCIERGCEWAMNLDGGGSVGLLEDGVLTMGAQTRMLPSALVIREVAVVEEGAKKPVYRQLSKNFNEKEFACPCCGKSLPDPMLVNKLQQMRDMLKKPIHINSGTRCIKHNFDVGGAPGSMHLSGKAADITVAGVSPKEVFKLAERLSFGGTFTHVDVGPSRRW
jgi:hypothetical protein